MRFEFEGQHVVRTESYYLMRLASNAVVARPEKDARQFEVVWLPYDQAFERLTYEPEKEWLRRALVHRPQAGGEGEGARH